MVLFTCYKYTKIWNGRGQQTQKGGRIEQALAGSDLAIFLSLASGMAETHV